MATQLRKALYFLSEALLNLVRHPLYTIVGILTLSVSLILVGFLGMFLWKADRMVERMSGGVQLTVFLREEISAEGVGELAGLIQGQWPEVERVEFHTADEDRERNLALLPAELARDLEPELIPAQPYIEVELSLAGLKDERVEEMVTWFDTLNQVEGVDEVLFGAEKISVAYSLISGVRDLGLFIATVIVLAGLFFVVTTTRLIVEGRKREIDILLLVGATRNFIRIPHYIEGMIQGCLAGGTAFLVVFLLQSRLAVELRSGAGLQVPLELLTPGMAVWFVAGGVGLGLLGSAMGLTRHLRLTQ